MSSRPYRQVHAVSRPFDWDIHVSSTYGHKTSHQNIVFPKKRGEMMGFRAFSGVLGCVARGFNAMQMFVFNTMQMLCVSLGSSVQSSSSLCGFGEKGRERE